MKVHLVDGTFELFRAFYAPRSKKTGPDGREIGATRQFLRSMISLLRDDDVTHVAVAFDHVIESFRNILFDGYKTGAGIDPLLWGQAPLVEEAAAALRVVVWPMTEFEADDALAAAAVRFAADERVDQVVICTPDKDLGQVVRGDRVVQLDRIRKKVIDEDAVQDKFGVPPEAIPDYLALVGDTADGIPGIPRWGAKSTSTVLAHYGRIEAIPDDADDWDPALKVRGAATLAQNLASQREDALLYRKLATLRTDVPLNESLDDLRWEGVDRPRLERLAVETLGSPELVDVLPPWR